KGRPNTHNVASGLHSLGPCGVISLHSEGISHGNEVPMPITTDAHPPYATILSIMGLQIPPIHYMVAAAGGGTIRCAPYATYGTADLSKHAVKALEDRF